MTPDAIAEVIRREMARTIPPPDTTPTPSQATAPPPAGLTEQDILDMTPDELIANRQKIDRYLAANL